MLNQIVLDISSVGRSIYTYERVNCVNVNGRDILSMQDDRIINFNSFTSYLRLK